MTPAEHLAEALAALRQGVDQLDADAALDVLAGEAELLDDIITEARAARALLHLPMASHMGEKVVREGQFELRCYQGMKRKRYDSDGLWSEVGRRAWFDPETGARMEPLDAFRRLHALVPTVLGVSPSTSWKVTGLRDLGIQVDEWCELEDGTVTVRVERIDPNGTVESEDAA